MYIIDISICLVSIYYLRKLEVVVNCIAIKNFFVITQPFYSK